MSWVMTLTGQNQTSSMKAATFSTSEVRILWDSLSLLKGMEKVMNNWPLLAMLLLLCLVTRNSSSPEKLHLCFLFSLATFLIKQWSSLCLFDWLLQEWARQCGSSIEISKRVCYTVCWITMFHVFCWRSLNIFRHIRGGSLLHLIFSATLDHK